jgi:hypothetical protein
MAHQILDALRDPRIGYLTEIVEHEYQRPGQLSQRDDDASHDLCAYQV